MKSFHKRGGSLRFHTLIQISYILLYTSSFTVKIWIRISQIQHGGGGHHFVKVFHKILLFFKWWLPLSSRLYVAFHKSVTSFTIPLSRRYQPRLYSSSYFFVWSNPDFHRSLFKENYQQSVIINHQKGSWLCDWTIEQRGIITRIANAVDLFWRIIVVRSVSEM